MKQDGRSHLFAERIDLLDPARGDHPADKTPCYRVLVGEDTSDLVEGNFTGRVGSRGESLSEVTNGVSADCAERKRDQKISSREWCQLLKVAGDTPVERSLF